MKEAEQGPLGRKRALQGLCNGAKRGRDRLAGAMVKPTCAVGALWGLGLRAAGDGGGDGDRSKLPQLLQVSVT